MVSQTYRIICDKIYIGDSVKVSEEVASESVFTEVVVVKLAGGFLHRLPSDWMFDSSVLVNPHAVSRSGV